jgi:TrmH family RNA methyltransferase
MSVPTGSEIITSAANPAIAFVRSLGRRDRRAAERAFVVEGFRAVRDALQSGALPRLVLVREGEEASAAALPLTARTPPRRVAARLFDRLSELQTPPGILAVFPLPDLAPDPDDAAPLLLVLDRLRDPGNLGTLLRAAAAAGVSAVYLTAESVDPWNAKVVRAAMGAHFRVPILPFTAAAGAALAERIPLRVLSEAGAARPYDAIDWSGPAALVIGGEAEGIGPELAEWGTETAAIPLAGGVESLNAAVAGGVILFEAARQRRSAAAGAGPPGGVRPAAGDSREGSISA